MSSEEPCDPNRTKCARHEQTHAQTTGWLSMRFAKPACIRPKRDVATRPPHINICELARSASIWCQLNYGARSQCDPLQGTPQRECSSLGSLVASFCNIGQKSLPSSAWRCHRSAQEPSRRVARSQLRRICRTETHMTCLGPIPKGKKKSGMLGFPPLSRACGVRTEGCKVVLH